MFCASLHNARPELATIAASACRGDAKAEVEAMRAEGCERMEAEVEER